MSESLKSKAYEFIKERILRCEYEPMSFLDVGAIADELSISRTPVRDAVSMLEQDELVQILPRHGIMVLGISADLINGIISTRKIVEPYAARSAALKADADVMQQMRTVFSEPGKDISALIEEDTKLHSYIVSCTENTYIIRMMDRIYSNSLLVEQYNYHGKYAGGFINSIIVQDGVKVATEGSNFLAVWRNKGCKRSIVTPGKSVAVIYSNNYRLMLYGSGMPGVFEASNAEHIAIIDAILERNPDKAEKSMLRHLSHSERTAYESAGILMKK